MLATPGNTRIRVAIVGLGAWEPGSLGTRAHLATLAARDDVDVVAVVDPDTAGAAAVADRYAVPRVEADFDALWADAGGLDAVVIVTPTDTHQRAVLAGLSAGCHVLCEKPLAFDVAQATEMGLAAQQAGVVARVGVLMRVSPVVARMKRLVDEGSIGVLRSFEFHSGNAQLIDPRRPRHWTMERARANGGVSVEYGSHGIDLALWFGGPITRVVAHGAILSTERPLSGGRGPVGMDDRSTWIGVYASGAGATVRTGWAFQPIGGGGVRL